MKEVPIKKLYYSISEVSRITSLKPYVLRYWETEFAELRPAKNRAGNRTYRKSDIELIFLIKRLLYTEKYTIEGARRRLRQLRKADGQQLRPSLEVLHAEDLLQEVKKGLKEILEILDQREPQHRGVAQPG